VAQAHLALKDKPGKVSKTVMEDLKTRTGQRNRSMKECRKNTHRVAYPLMRRNQVG